jgi:archaellum component FlaC
MDSEASLILGMLAEGKIDTRQALGLLKALEESEEAADAIAQVEARADSGESERTTDAARAAQPAAHTPGAASQHSEPSPWTRIPSPERIGEIAGSIGDIIAASVDKGVEAVTRLAGRARHEASHIERRVKRLRIHKRVARDIARPMKRLASMGKGPRPDAPEGTLSRAFSGWASGLSGTFRTLPHGESLESLSDAVEELEDAVDELGSLLEQVDDATQEAYGAEDLEGMAEAVAQIGENAEEAIDQIAEIEHALTEARAELDAISGDKDWAAGIAALQDSWRGVAADLRPRLEEAMALQQSAQAALRQMIVAWRGSGPDDDR